jgi:hypothetical protein
VTEEWVQLFNGKDLTGWTSKNNSFGLWKVEKGNLIGQGNQARLRTERDNFKDFHLRLEAKYVTGEANLVIREQPDVISKGYTIFMGNKPATFQSGALTTYFGAKAGPLHIQDKELTKTNEWFTLEVIAQGNRLQVLVNGVRTADAEDANTNFMEGFFCLRITAKDGELHVRKIEIKELPPAKPAPASQPVKIKSLEPAKDQPATQVGVSRDQGGWKIESKLKGDVLLFIEAAQAVEPQGRLVLRGKSKGMQPRDANVDVQMLWRKPNGIQGGTHLGTIPTKNDWEPFTASLMLNDRPSVIELSVRFASPGTVWIKDLELVWEPPVAGDKK